MNPSDGGLGTTCWNAICIRGDSSMMKRFCIFSCMRVLLSTPRLKLQQHRSHHCRHWHLRQHWHEAWPLILMSFFSPWTWRALNLWSDAVQRLSFWCHPNLSSWSSSCYSVKKRYDSIQSKWFLRFQLCSYAIYSFYLFYQLTVTISHRRTV